MSERSLSFGLIVRNEERNICELLNQIYDLMFSYPVEIIVVDNGSVDKTISLVKFWMETHSDCMVRLLIRTENNMAEARNQVLREADSEWVYFIDADCRLGVSVGSDIYEKIEFFAKDTSVAAIGGGNTVGGDTHWLERRLSDMSQIWLGHMGSIQVTSPKKMKGVALLSTCNMLVHRKKSLAVGGFDSQFITVGEDMSLCHRLRKAGFKLMAIPGFDVVHLQRMSMLRWCKKMYGYGEAQVRIAAIYSEHFMGVRGLQFAIVWAGLGLLFVDSKLLAVLVAGYIFSLFTMSVVSLKTFTRALKATGFIFVSQFFYATGELVGTVTSLRLFISSHLPSKIPALEQK